MMSKKRNFIAVLPLSERLRELILSEFPPAFDLAYCRHVTLAYNVPKDRGLVDAVGREPVVNIYGRVIDGSRGTDALAVTVNDAAIRPDGVPYHITMSVEPGVQPMLAGRFEPKDIAWFDKSLSFTAPPSFIARRVIEPEIRTQAA